MCFSPPFSQGLVFWGFCILGVPLPAQSPALLLHSAASVLFSWQPHLLSQDLLPSQALSLLSPFQIDEVSLLALLGFLFLGCPPCIFLGGLSFCCGEARPGCRQFLKEGWSQTEKVSLSGGAVEPL